MPVRARVDEEAAPAGNADLVLGHRRRRHLRDAFHRRRGEEQLAVARGGAHALVLEVRLVAEVADEEVRHGAALCDAIAVEAGEGDAVGVGFEQASHGGGLLEGPEDLARSVDGGDALLGADEECPAVLTQRGDAAQLGKLLALRGDVLPGHIVAAQLVAQLAQ